MNLSFILSMNLNSFTLKSVSPESGGRPLTVRFFLCLPDMAQGVLPL